MNKILLFCGSKDSGKTSAAKFVAGYFLNRAGVIKEFAQDFDGNLDVQIRIQSLDGTDKFSSEFAQLDLRRTDNEFIWFAEKNIWPYVKLYAFADELKSVTHQIFGLDVNLMYGNNEDKETLTYIKWEHIAKLLPKITTISNVKEQEYMTIREFLQIFGTDICRTILNDCWIDACFRNIIYENSELAIIDDGRFMNEIYRSKQLGAKVIKLERKLHIDNHKSENDLDQISKNNFDYIIDNTNMTLSEKNQAIFQALKNFGWVAGNLI